jgi:hypothetical protein
MTVNIIICDELLTCVIGEIQDVVRKQKGLRLIVQILSESKDEELKAITSVAARALVLGVHSTHFQLQSALSFNSFN